MKRLLLSFLVLLFFLSGCSFPSTTPPPESTPTEENDLRFDGRRYFFDGNAENFRAEADCFTILTGGVYRVSGTLTEGSLRVCAPADQVVHLIFDGVSIASSYHSPLFLEEAASVVLELADGTVNRLTDAARSEDGTGALPVGCLSANCDLILRGGGTLCVSGRQDAALSVMGDLRLTDAVLSLSASSLGIFVRDRLLMDSGSLTVSASRTGIATDDATSSVGLLRVMGGRLVISATETALHASGEILVKNAEVSLRAPKKYDAPKVTAP